MTRTRIPLLVGLIAALAAPALAHAQPPLTLPADFTVEATSSAGALVTYTASTDPSATLACSPASATVFALGSTTVNCTATNPSTGEQTSGKFQVTVSDTTPPVLGTTPDVTAEATSRAGATVSYTAPAATDAVDGDRPVTCTPDSGLRFPLGKTTVTCTAADLSGHTGTTTFAVVVADTTAPVFAPRPVDVEKRAGGQSSVPVTYQLPTATDAVEGKVDVVCTPASGSPFPVGKTTVVCETSDAYGNTAQVSFIVHVVPSPPKARASDVFLTRAATVSAPPLLHWNPVAKAAYYNVQVFTGGHKILSIWPLSNHMQLTGSWVFAGSRRALKPGLYVWYVWPGYGPIAAARYGRLLGRGTFTLAG